MIPNLQYYGPLLDFICLVCYHKFMKLYSETHPHEATPIQKAKLAGIAHRGVEVDRGREHLRASHSDFAYFVSVGREDAHASELIRIAKVGSPNVVETGQQFASDHSVYGRPVSREAADAAIWLADQR